MASFEGQNCPLFSEASEFYINNNPFINQTMAKHEGTVKKWIQKRLNITQDIDEQWVKRIIDEMITNKFEQRYIPYEEVSDEEWAMMQQYLSDYMYIYMFGTDSLTKVLSSELMSFILNRFESKAKV